MAVLSQQFFKEGDGLFSGHVDSTQSGESACRIFSVTVKKAVCSLYALFAAKWCYSLQFHAKLHDCRGSWDFYLNPCCQAVMLSNPAGVNRSDIVSRTTTAGFYETGLPGPFSSKRRMPGIPLLFRFCPHAPDPESKLSDKQDVPPGAPSLRCRASGSLGGQHRGGKQHRRSTGETNERTLRAGHELCFCVELRPSAVGSSSRTVLGLASCLWL